MSRFIARKWSNHSNVQNQWDVIYQNSSTGNLHYSPTMTFKNEDEAKCVANELNVHKAFDMARAWPLTDFVDINDLAIN